MNNFEKTAIYTVIDTIEVQLRGLKNMVAAANGGQAKTQSTVTRTESGDFATELSDDEEKRLEQTLKQAQDEEVGRMRAQAEKFAQEQIQQILANSTGQKNFIPAPPPHPLENNPGN